VLGTFLLAQLQKYRLHPKQKITGVFFDKDLGAAVAIRAMGGKYYPLKNGIATGWNPFKLDPTPQNITFVESLMRWFCMRNDQTLTPAQEKQLSDAVRSVFAAKPEIRRFRSILQFLPNTEIGGLNTRLERWCLDGPNAWLFDNESDNLNLTDYPIIGFDVTDFLENEETRTPTMMYLLHRIDSLFDGRKVPIFMDEFSKLLDDPAFENLSKNKLVTIRKQDGFLVMFLQYPEQALSSKIAQGLISQTATKIFLPNPGADHKAYVEGFKCTEAEYNVIRRLGEKSRKFLVKQGNQSIVNRYFLQLYVRHREGFNRATARQNYVAVGLMSSRSIQTSYADWFSPRNPTSPLNTHGEGHRTEISIRSTSFLAPETALVRFIKEQHQPGVARPILSYWAATITFIYQNPPTSQKDREINPLGFQVTGYRVDPESLNAVEGPATPRLIQTSPPSTPVYVPDEQTPAVPTDPVMNGQTVQSIPAEDTHQKPLEETAP